MAAGAAASAGEGFAARMAALWEEHDHEVRALRGEVSALQAALAAVAAAPPYGCGDGSAGTSGGGEGEAPFSVRINHADHSAGLRRTRRVLRSSFEHLAPPPLNAADSVEDEVPFEPNVQHPPMSDKRSPGLTQGTPAAAEKTGAGPASSSTPAGLLETAEALPLSRSSHQLVTKTSGLSEAGAPGGMHHRNASSSSLAAASKKQTLSTNHQKRVLSKVANKGKLAQAKSFDEVMMRSHTVQRRFNVEIFFASLIVLNAIWVGWQTAWEAQAQGRSLPYGAVVSVKAFFCMLFVAELVFRFTKDCHFVRNLRRSGCHGYDCQNGLCSDLFDLVLVVGLIIDVVLFSLRQELGTISRACTVLRGFRLMRIARVLELVHYNWFRELRIFTSSLHKAFFALLWIMMVLTVCIYGIAVFMTSLATAMCKDEHGGDEGLDLLCTHFGSLWQAVLVLCQAMFGGMPWGEVVTALAPAGPLFQVIFTIFMIFMSIAILNVVTGIILDTTQQAQKRERETVIRDEMRKREEHIMAMRDIFWEIDTNKSGELSLDELELACQDLRMDALMTSMNLRVFDISRLFEMLDADGTGAVGIEEFIMGCERLGGDAKAVDLVPVHQMTTQILHCVQELRQAQLGITPDPQSRKGTAMSAVATPPTTPGSAGVDGGQGMGGGGWQAAPPRSIATAGRSDQHCLSATRNLDLNKPLSRKHKAGCIIQQTEMRAMTLAEMEDLRTVIEKNCTSRSWVHQVTSETISAREVDLYMLAYNYICPITTLGTVVLKGLQERQYLEGSIVEQSNSRAVGRVKVDCAGPDVEVEVLRGQFRAPRIGESSQLAVEGHDCGPLGEVCCPNSVSYKELISKKPEKPLWYCTHWWGETVLDFIAGCSEHARRRNLNNTVASYWVCGYANRQNSLASEIHADPTQSSFYKAMCLAEGVLLVLDDGARVFSRIWCDFELYVNLTSASKKLDIVTVEANEDQEDQRLARLLSTGRLPFESAHDQSKREHNFPITLFLSGLCVNLEDGKATVEADRQHILKYLVQCNGLVQANRCLHSLFAKAVWPQALRRGIVEDFHDDELGRVSLPEVLAMDEGRTQLDMSFAHMEEVGVQAMRSIGRGLPPNLRELALGFEGCSNVTDQGLEELALGFPSSIEVLKLDFLGCKKVTDLGVNCLAAAIPQGILEVALHFDNCTHVSYDSLQALSSAIPKSCQRFRGTFCGTQIDCNFRNLADLRSRVQKLERKRG